MLVTDIQPLPTKASLCFLLPATCMEPTVTLRPSPVTHSLVV